MTKVGLREMKKKIEGEYEKTMNRMMETGIYTLPSWLEISSKFIWNAESVVNISLC